MQQDKLEASSWTCGECEDGCDATEEEWDQIRMAQRQAGRRGTHLPGKFHELLIVVVDRGEQPYMRDLARYLPRVSARGLATARARPPLPPGAALSHSPHDASSFFIGGEWVRPVAPRAQLAVIDPSTEAVVTSISLGSADDVDRAVNAARGAFEGWGETTKEQRLEHLERLVAVYERRQAEMAQAISTEMGAPMTMALTQQAAAGLGHLKAANRVLRDFEFGETPLPGAKPGSHERIVHEPVGVCGLICPWNWPMNQVALKVAPALAAGCTVVLKPSEIAPLSSLLFAEMVDEAGFPPGVFNLVHRDQFTLVSRRILLMTADTFSKGERRRRHRWPRARESSWRRHGLIHWFDARRRRGHQGGGRYREEGGARAWRQGR